MDTELYSSLATAFKGALPSEGAAAERMERGEADAVSKLLRRRAEAGDEAETGGGEVRGEGRGEVDGGEAGGEVGAAAAGDGAWGEDGDARRQAKRRRKEAKQARVSEFK